MKVVTTDFDCALRPLPVAVATCVPFGERGEVAYGFGGMLTLGVDLELWHKAAAPAQVD